MARHLRLLYEGALYHVSFRGVNRQDLFLDERDRERFLERVAESVAMFGSGCTSTA
jgi:REP element-mobilizing transposase RayT